MSKEEPTDWYVYQPDPPTLGARIYGVAGPHFEARIRGLTKDEATAVCAALRALNATETRETEKGR